MTKLPAAYTAAQRALIHAVKVEEVAHVKRVAEGMEVLAIKARDPILAGDAARLKVGATRKLGVLMKAEKAAGKLKEPGRPGKKRVFEKPISATLADRGVDKNLAHRARSLEAMPESKYEKHLAKVIRVAVAAAEGNREVVLAAKVERHTEAKAKRAAREKQFAGKVLALPKKKFGVILTDNEWLFETYSEKGKLERSAENHYTTSDLDTLKARDIDSIAADDCVLFMWATAPMLPQALEVMMAWGFDYKSHLIWVKDRIGTGYWFRNRHELLLVGTRGNIPAPAQGSQWDSVLNAARAEHSEKPDVSYKLIEAYFPNVPKIELNARVARDGWSRWGFEAPEEAA
jgi:N6-adenosine-specific RNA methylase IME4